MRPIKLGHVALHIGRPFEARGRGLWRSGVHALEGLAVDVGPVKLINFLCGLGLKICGGASAGLDLGIRVTVCKDTVSSTDIIAGPLLRIWMSKGIQRRVDIVWSRASERLSWGTWPRGNDEARVSGLEHGHEAVNVAVVKPEYGIEGGLGDDGHVAANINVDDIVNAFKIGGKLLVGCVSEEVEGLLLTGREGADEDTIIGSADGSCAKALGNPLVLIEFWMIVRVIITDVEI